jgi:hypothetical protein
LLERCKGDAGADVMAFLLVRELRLFSVAVMLTSVLSNEIGARSGSF